MRRATATREPAPRVAPVALVGMSTRAPGTAENGALESPVTHDQQRVPMNGCTSCDHGRTGTLGASNARRALGCLACPYADRHGTGSPDYAPTPDRARTGTLGTLNGVTVTGGRAATGRSAVARRKIVDLVRVLSILIGALDLGREDIFPSVAQARAGWRALAIKLGNGDPALSSWKSIGQEVNEDGTA